MTNVMTKNFSRQKLLAHLAAHPGATAAEMARVLNVTPANVRHHLAILVADGRVTALGARPSERRGRPQQIYSVNDAPDLSALVDVLLAEWFGNVPAGEMEAALRAVAVRLAAVDPSGGSLAPLRRLSLTIEHLNRLGYRARWEATAAGPRILLERCPYAAILSRHPQLCRMDALLLESRLSTPVEQTARLEQNERGLAVCAFLVGRR